ncbi:hypothetical protein [Gordonia insulae]|uniref:Uncharacterized protein n=1 Tax=Gordonia insulae TaxID=2420509 RepID=A0A3G8JEX4_9ACTN|nr:hypothetical protein [Gordonia insulae]AZG43458.1 hypothetical protein D7316_00022 [Gordonia insulae]
MTDQADTNDRFTLLCAEVAAAVKGDRGHVDPRHIIDIRDHLLEPIYEIRQQARDGRPPRPGRIDQLWDRFTDITGIAEPT